MNTIMIAVITAVTLVASGAFAGYVTNKYAVRWLFKPVTVFGKQVFDVSILSTDEKQAAFIESLSDCVERRILTSEVIKNELINESMRVHLDEIVDVFLSATLPDGLKKMRPEEMEGFADTAEGLRNFIEDMAGENLDPLLIRVLDEVRVSDYLTEAQIDRGVDNVYDSVKIALKENYAVRDLLARLAGELFIQAMFDRDGRTAVAKLTSKFFKSGSPRMSPTGPFDVDGLTLPEKIKGSVKTIIINAVENELKGKSVGEFTSPDVRESIEKIIKREILRKYDEKIASLSEEEMAKLGADVSKKLSGSEGVKTGFSNFLFDYLEKHIEGLLDGKVRFAVKLALGKLDPDQLLEVAEKLMKGQLAYLSYFGAVLGFIISIPALAVTLGTFTATGFAGSVPIFLFLVALMGAIGVLTNVIAIQMFFHPYKQIGFLAKKKKLKVFSVGIIIQNQKAFANTLGEYIGYTLLTAENITDTLNRYEDTFTSTLVDMVVPSLKEWLENEDNRREMSDRLSTLVFGSMDKNRKNLANSLCASLGAKNIDGYINLNNPAVREKADALFDRLLDRLADNPPEGFGEDSGSSENALTGLFGAALGLNLAYEKANSSGDDEEASDFRFITWALAKLIRRTPSLRDRTRELILVFALNETSKKGFGDIFSMKEVGDCLENNIHSLCVSEAAYEDFRTAVNVCCSSLVIRSSELVSETLVNRVAYTGAGAAFDALIAAVPALVEDIHIGEVTEVKVAGLEPEEIKNVIMSFAGDAIHKLYALGLIGCVFGINTYLAFIIFVIDKIREG